MAVGQALDEIKGLRKFSNGAFLKWFLAVNAGLVLTTVAWLGAGSLFFPIVGMAGSFLSLYFAKWLAKRAHRIQVINPEHPKSGAEKELLALVGDLAQRAGLPRTPEVGVYDSPDINAFATGSSPSNALVAFSSRLLDELPVEQIRAVAAHEVAHIANRDMLAVVLLQGVINAIVLGCTFPLNALRVLNVFSDQASWLAEIMLWLAKLFVALVLTFVGSLVVKAFSRHREFRADALAAQLVGTDSMVAVLETLSQDTAAIPREQLSYAAFKIAGRPSLGEIFSTHPAVERRIAALRAGVSGADQASPSPSPAQPAREPAEASS